MYRILKKILAGHENEGSHRVLPHGSTPGYLGLIRVNIRYEKNGSGRENFFNEERYFLKLGACENCLPTMQR